MEIQQLMYFAKIAELQNITKAANQLYISQPALSKAIHNLEEELNTQLFIRKGRSIYLTPPGEVFYQRTQSILNSLASARREIDEISNAGNQSVRLMFRALAGIIPEILEGFAPLYPDVQFSLHQAGELAISESEYDLIIYPSYGDTPSRNKKFLLQEDIYLVVSDESPLAKQDTCSFEDIKDYPFIHTTKSRFYWDILESYFMKYGFTPKTFVYSDTPTTIIDLVQRGLGITFLPEYSVNPYALKGLKLLSMKEGALTRDVCIKWTDGAYLPQYATAFCKFVQKFFEV